VVPKAETRYFSIISRKARGCAETYSSYVAQANPPPDDEIAGKTRFRTGTSYTAVMTYQVLARTWRPQTFADVIGQEAVVQTLHNALSAGTLGHAYVFSGIRGVGKTTAARLLAKAVNCEKGPAPEPCCQCVSCMEIAQGSSLDVVEIDAATHTGVDNVRELQEMLRYRPTRDRYRVIIVDEVHMLSKSAFNALLKSLEEPPPYILWIFATTETHKIPPTILSRCQQLEFRPVPLEKIVTRLLEIAEEEKFELSRDAASMVARAAQGSVRDALSMIDQMRGFSADAIDADAVAEVLGVPRFEVVIDLISALAGGDAMTGLGMLRSELRAGHDAWVLYQEVGRVLRVLLHLSVNADVAEDLPDDQRRQASGVAESLGAAALTRMAGLWLEHEALVGSADNRELALDVACLRLARWPAVQRVEALLAGETPPVVGGEGPMLPSSGVPSDSGGGGVHASASPGGRLSAALWAGGRRRLVGTVEGAQIRLSDDQIVMEFSTQNRALGVYARENLDELEVVCREVFSGSIQLRVEFENGASESIGNDDELMRTAVEDPGVRLVQKVLGGEVKWAVPDGNPN